MERKTNLFFIRHGKLLLPYKNHSEMPFQVLADLASGKLNPSIDREFASSLLKEISVRVPFKDLEIIYTSPSKRCNETASLIADFISKEFRKRVQIVKISELIEITFDLNKLYFGRSKDHFDIEGINNKVFLEMIKGDKCESTLDAYNRVGSVFKKIDKSKTCLLVTHDFFMRIIEIYIKNQGKDNPLIIYDTLRKTKRNLYLHGFSTDSSFSSFSPF